ncbi:hypothetical protein LS73_007610 [Helicobacter muridarum]|uniref:Beta-lactamase n=1 Tax=Helicobacter muridarum TaxID=216 RepID=A0A377PU13_9HELI|nr:hypothetical protein [Helicobacter muridarum]TLD99275.1 hypothetical protein LS73_007610 [Helicobacter muridarum]STQ86135.1 cysteine-rich protein H [Helicobacter muridarum]
MSTKKKLIGYASQSLLGIFIMFFAVACFKQNTPQHQDDAELDTSEITKLHQEMNEKNGLTNGYFASIAVANDEYDKAYKIYYEECKKGSTISCLDAYFIGEERGLEEYNSEMFTKDLEASVKRSLKACNENISLGCVNTFFAFESLDENDEFLREILYPILEKVNDEHITDKALNLTKKECENDDATSCFYHARILRSIDSYADVDYLVDKNLNLGYALAPFVLLQQQAPQNLAYFKRACDIDEAVSCRYVGYWLEKYENDLSGAKQFYKKACDLGLEQSCIDASKPATQKKDELGAPVVPRR